MAAGEYHPFGRRVAINRLSMRSPEVSPSRSDPRELRLLVLGDSVVNGGSHVDQAEIATELLAGRLRALCNRPVFVGNASAGGWGPANILGWIRRFGLLDSDVVVVVLSSHDYFDVPSFHWSPIDLPSSPPTSLAVFAAARAASGLYTRASAAWRRATGPDVSRPRPDAAADLDALFETIREGVRNGRVVQHWTRSELEGRGSPRHEEIRALAEADGLPVADFGPALAREVESGVSVFLDDIHLTRQGQAALAGFLFESLGSEHACSLSAGEPAPEVAADRSRAGE